MWVYDLLTEPRRRILLRSQLASSRGSFPLRYEHIFRPPTVEVTGITAACRAVSRILRAACPSSLEATPTPRPRENAKPHA